MVALAGWPVATLLLGLLTKVTDDLAWPGRKVFCLRAMRQISAAGRT